MVKSAYCDEYANKQMSIQYMQTGNTGMGKHSCARKRMGENRGGGEDEKTTGDNPESGAF